MYVTIVNSGKKMITAAAKILTLLGVLFHAGLGCCAHHDHCLKPDSSFSATTVEAKVTPPRVQCACRFHSQHQQDEAESANVLKTPDDHESCPCGDDHGSCQDHCFWLTASRVDVPDYHQIERNFASLELSEFVTERGMLSRLSLLEAAPLASCCSGAMRANIQVWRL